MSTNPLILSAAILFWGWQVGMLFLAAPMALIPAASVLVKSRWEFSSSDFVRISDISSILFAGLTAYLLVTQKPVAALLLVLRLLPVVLFPLTAAQLFGAEKGVDMGAIFWSARKKKPGSERAGALRADLTPFYFAACLMCASLANARTPFFYLGLVALTSLAVFGARSKRYSLNIWLAAFFAAAFLGVGVHSCLFNLQAYLEDAMVDWYSDRLRMDADPFRNTTALGDMEDLKFSGRILFRVKAGPGVKGPLLLREASYDTLKAATWYAANRPFISQAPKGTGYEFAPGSRGGRKVTVALNLKKGKGLLKLPNRTFAVDNLPVGELSRNLMGAVRVEDAPSLVIYGAHAGVRSVLDGRPGPADLAVPKALSALLDKTASGLDLSPQRPFEAMKNLHGFFAKNFRYSLKKEDRAGAGGAIARFLTTSRAGHCEYFATASVLLLRAAGIPARYATGFSASEPGGLGGWMAVRSRHAHAWALVYADGAWRDLDTTPPGWEELEDTGSYWENISDSFSFLSFSFSEWRTGKKGLKNPLVWILFVPLAVILIRNLKKKGSARRVRITKKGRSKEAGPGRSELWEIEAHLKALGYERPISEPFGRFARRLAELRPPPPGAELLPPLAYLYYVCRFDPAGANSSQQKALENGVADWLESAVTAGGAAARGEMGKDP